MRLAFVVRSLFFQKPSFTTIHLAREAVRAGHEVAFLHLNGITWKNSGEVEADAVTPGDPNSLLGFLEPLRQESPPYRKIPLDRWDGVFLRFNPFHGDFNEDLTVHPILPVASALEKRGVRVLNSPDGLRRAASKGYVLEFPPSVRPRTLVSRNPERIKAFLEELGRPAILKPLSGSGGSNVFYVGSRQEVNLNQILSAIRHQSYVLAQEYLPGGRDKRVLLWNGRAVQVDGRTAVFQRVSPEGEIRSNMQLGATRQPCELSPAEQEVLEVVGPRLRQDGIVFAGVDLVGERLLEINVFCAGGIQNCNELYGINVGAAVIESLEKELQMTPPPVKWELQP